MYNNQKVSVIIAAAGSGMRLGSDIPKQFLELGGKPILARTAEVFGLTSAVDEIIIVVHRDYIEHCKEEIINKYALSKIAAVLPGGASRSISVYSGLCRATGEIVLVHDGARPFVSPEVVLSVISGAAEFGCCIPGVVPKDTVKLCADDENVTDTPKRERLRLIQTPQGFKREILMRAYEKAFDDGFEGTDDSSLAERLGCIVKIVPGSYDNIKITTQDDLLTGEHLCMNRRSGR